MKKTQSMDIDISLRHPVYFLLMRSPEIRREIEELYMEQEEHYRNIIRDLKPKTHFFNGIQTGDKWNILLMEAITKEIEERGAQEYRQFLLDLVKKSYKRIYDYAMQNPQYNPEMFSRYIESREPNLANDKLGLYQYLYLYICKDNPSFLLPKTPYTGIVLENLILGFRDITLEREILILTDEEKKEALEVFTSITGEKWRNNEPKLVEDVFGAVEVQAIRDNPTLRRRIAATGNTRLSYNIKPLSHLRYALANLEVLEYENIYFFYDVSITKDDWCQLYKNYLLGVEGKGFTMEDRNELLMFSLVQYAQHIAYKQLEDKFWQMKFTENASEIRREQSLLKENYVDLKKEKELFEREKIKMEEAFLEQQSKYEAEVERLKKEVELLTKENQKLSENVELLPVLQEAIFQDEAEAVHIEETLVVDMLADKQMVLVGGHDNFRLRMKEHFPNLYTIAPEEASVGTTQVKNADIILFETGYNNHMQFNRLKNNLSKEQTLIFLNSITSIERVEQEIYTNLKKRKNS